MSNHLAIHSLLQWLPWLGWALVFAGWIGQRKTTQHWVNKIQTIGWGNHVHNEVNFSQTAASSDEKTGDSLGRWSNWATIAGLFVSLFPLLQSAFQKTP
ncbi:hypothetical protein [Limnohabitans sp. T6-5]|uniref:hypothetical protein n=1 Tax=Limnohabitans sp. T6-5 TaxID=1100724 RepID=UPI0011B200EE|nr:hypothetical protein [Limnohabitans sp. T6-5]